MRARDRHRASRAPTQLWARAGAWRLRSGELGVWTRLPQSKSYAATVAEMERPRKRPRGPVMNDLRNEPRLRCSTNGETIFVRAVIQEDLNRVAAGQRKNNHWKRYQNLHALIKEA